MANPPRNFVPKPFAYHEEIELRIDDLASLGEGVGRFNNWVVMVPFTLPGERVRVRIWRNKANYSDADLVEILEPSPERVTPACPLFGRCGGCQYQHLTYSAQLAWKQRQIEQLMKRMAGLEVPVQPTWPSPQAYGYRSKLTPHYAKPAGGRSLVIGFQKADSRALLDVPQCPIASAAINEALPQVRAEAQVRLQQRRKGGTLLLRDAQEGVVTDMKASVSERVGQRLFQFQAGEFFQNNPYILPELVDYALDQATAPGVRYLIDAYCGVGVFGICGAGRFERVAGVEVSATALKWARANAVLNQVDNIQFTVGSAEAIFEGLELPGGESAVILDPPRKGCDQVFLDQLFRFAPARVVYVSCGPDTQARDLKAFVQAGYQVDRVQPFDLFPQTRHIENVVTLSAGA